MTSRKCHGPIPLNSPPPIFGWIIWTISPCPAQLNMALHAASVTYTHPFHILPSSFSLFLCLVLSPLPSLFIYLPSSASFSVWFTVCELISSSSSSSSFFILPFLYSISPSLSSSVLDITFFLKGQLQAISTETFYEQWNIPSVPGYWVFVFLN